MSFEQFMEEVDSYLLGKCHMQSDDIDDWHYYDDYQDGLTPEASAEGALENAGFYD